MGLQNIMVKKAFQYYNSQRLFIINAMGCSCIKKVNFTSDPFELVKGGGWLTTGITVGTRDYRTFYNILHSNYEIRVEWNPE